jgi:hypothetical protein
MESRSNGTDWQAFGRESRKRGVVWEVLSVMSIKSFYIP